MNIILDNLDGFQTLLVNDFKCESMIVVNFEVVLDISSDTTVTDVAKTINLTAGSDGNIGNQIYITVDQDFDDAGKRNLSVLTILSYFAVFPLDL